MTAASSIKILAAAAEKYALRCAYGEMDVQAAVDCLQYYAARADLVAELGQDRVQDIVAAAFIWARQYAEEQADFAYDPGYGRRMIERWEAGDAKQPPVPKEPKPAYRTPDATIAAFWIVAGKGDPDYLARWLAAHPRDVEQLHAAWRAQCSTLAA